MFKLCILTPTTGFCRTAYAMSLAKLVMYYAQNRIYDGVETQFLNIDSIEGSGISANRERLIEKVRNGDTTHILFIDEDMGFAPDTLHILASRKKEVVGCNYRMRVRGGDFTALAENRESRLQLNEDSTGLEKVYYTGFGFCLIDISVFDRLEKPWFLIGYDLTHGHYSTEDCAFAKRLRKAGIDWYCDNDASKKIIHYGNEAYPCVDVPLTKECQFSIKNGTGWDLSVGWDLKATPKTYVPGS